MGDGRGFNQNAKEGNYVRAGLNALNAGLEWFAARGAAKKVVKVPKSTKSKGPKPTPKFKSPTNSPQLPLKDVPEGMNIRLMKPTEQYPNG